MFAMKTGDMRPHASFYSKGVYFDYTQHVIMVLEFRSYRVRYKNYATKTKVKSGVIQRVMMKSYKATFVDED